MLFLADLGSPVPKALHTAAVVVLNNDLRRAFTQEAPDHDRVRALLEEARAWHVELDTAGLAYVLRQTIERLAERLRAEPTEPLLLQRLEAMVSLSPSFPFEVNLSRAQNIYYELMKTLYPQLQAKAAQGDETAQRWVGRFVSLGESLRIRIVKEDQG